jgi:hypothetical protein
MYVSTVTVVVTYLILDVVDVGGLSACSSRLELSSRLIIWHAGQGSSLEALISLA